MPQVAAKAIRMIEDADTTGQELNDLLSNDTALAARVLKIANSAMFSRQREITTLAQSVMIIGFKALKGIIVAATLRQLNKKFGATERMVWEHSMSVAMCSTLVARKLRKSYVDEIFLLGLLHSMGQIVLLSQKETAKRYKEVMEKIKDGHVVYVDAEQEIFGFGHPLIGALVSKKWNFAQETCQAILHYQDPLESTLAENELEEKTAIIKFADAVSHLSGIGSPLGYPDMMNTALEAAKYLGFEDSSLEDVIESIITDTQEQFEKEGSVYA